jgi:hypothetical protein
MESIIDVCHRERLVLLADEVYQENVYVSHKSFVSFKRVLHDMGPRYANQELMSFHSVSKGFVGECGKRGGYVEMTNIDEDVLQEYYKLCSINLCPNVLGMKRKLYTIVIFSHLLPSHFLRFLCMCVCVCVCVPIIYYFGRPSDAKLESQSSKTRGHIIPTLRQRTRCHNFKFEKESRDDL